MTKKGAFANKGKSILGPTGLADFLGEKPVTVPAGEKSRRDDVKTDDPETKPEVPSNRKIRQELRLQEDLWEALRHYAFQKRQSKNEVLNRALSEFFSREGFQIKTP